MLSLKTRVVIGLAVAAFTLPTFGMQGDSACPTSVDVLKKHAFGAGVGWVDLKPVNDKLASLGLSEFQTYGLSLDFEHQTVIHRMMMGGELKGLLFKDRLTGNTRTTFSAGELLLHSGYNVIENEHINLYPYVGLGAGLMNLVVGDKNTSFDTALVRPNTNLNVYQFRFVIDLGLGVDLMGGNNPSRLGLIGLRAGYTFDPTKSDRWMRDGLYVTDAPQPTLNGAYVVLTLGGATRKTVNVKDWKLHHQGMHHEEMPADSLK